VDIYSVAALIASRWTDWCLRSCSFPMSVVFDEAPANWQGMDLLSPGWGGCVSVIGWCGIGEEDDNEKKWEVLRIIHLASGENGRSSRQHVHYTQDESCCIKLQVVEVSHSPEMCNKLVRCCWFIHKDTFRCTTAEVGWLSALNRTLFKGKHFCWCLSQIIPRIIHETDANNRVILYG